MDAEQQIYETLHKDISTTETQIKEIKKWFTEHEHFKDIIPHISLILNLIHETEIARNQKLSNEKTLISLNKTLEAQEKKLTQAKTERENLEKHLPKEIILWRSRLVEGSPCPVCGSIHHPIKQNTDTSEESLQSEKLEELKENDLFPFGRNRTNLDFYRAIPHFNTELRNIV